MRTFKGLTSLNIIIVQWRDLNHTSLQNCPRILKAFCQKENFWQKTQIKTQIKQTLAVSWWVLPFVSNLQTIEMFRVQLTDIFSFLFGYSSDPCLMKSWATGYIANIKTINWPLLLNRKISRTALWKSLTKVVWVSVVILILTNKIA